MIAIPFAIGVLLSELSQLGVWKANNLDKPWAQWFRWGIPHFLTNLVFVTAIYALWSEQLLDNVITWFLSWFGLSSTMEWDKLLPWNNTVGLILGGGADMFGDKLGFLVKIVAKKIPILNEESAPKDNQPFGGSPNPGGDPLKKLTAAVLLALLSVLPATAAHRKGDQDLHGTVAYNEQKDIPGSEELIRHCPPLYGDPDTTHPYSVGVGYSYFLGHKTSFELEASVPSGDAGTDTLGGEVGLNFYLKNFYIPTRLAYRGDLDSLLLDAGAGYEWGFGKTGMFRTEAKAGYFEDTDIEDRWTWQAAASIGWRLKRR